MCESGASNRQVNWNCSLVVTSTFAGRRPETDRCWETVEGLLLWLPVWEGCLTCFFVFFCSASCGSFPRCLMVWADYRVCLCHHTACLKWERKWVCLQTEHRELSDAAVLLINYMDGLNSQIQIWFVCCVYFIAAVVWPYSRAVVPL